MNTYDLIQDAWMEMQQKEDVPEKILELRREALHTLYSIIRKHENDFCSSTLPHRICEQKLQQIAQATTKKEIKQILTPPKPYFDGQRFTDSNPFHLDEEELLLWSITSMFAPLHGYAVARYAELFKKVCPAEYEKAFGGKKA